MEKIKFKKSRFIKALPLGNGKVAVANLFRSSRCVLSQRTYEQLQLFKNRTLDQEEFSKKANVSVKRAHEIIQFFTSTQFLVEASIDEEKQIKDFINHNAIDFQSPANWDLLIDFKGIESKPSTSKNHYFSKLPTETLKMLILGGCYAQFMENLLKAKARSYGIELKINSAWPKDTHLIDSIDPKILFYQPHFEQLFSSMKGFGTELTDTQRQKSLESMKKWLKLELSPLLKKTKGRLLIAQGVSSPAISPFGRIDFRKKYGISKIIFELNEYIKDMLRPFPNCLFIDEEGIFSRTGKKNILDDVVIPYQHHGPIDIKAGVEPPGPSREHSFQITTPLQSMHLLSDEIISHYLIWSGRGKIKCIILDLDNTLWPGVLGESKQDFSETKFRHTFQQGTYGGIHQAVQILRQRGIVLASCSKNNQKEAFAYWKKLSKMAKNLRISHFLDPDDFVIHKINWKRKSENISDLLREIEIDPGAALFIDDNPVEREEVEQAFSSIRTEGSSMNLIRASLLSNPCLENNINTPESARRFKMIKAQLKRNQTRASTPSEKFFLKSLKVKINISKLKNYKNLERVAELTQRTSQFNTTGKKYDIETLKSFISSRHYSIYVAEVSDKFTSYGTVAACILERNQIDTFVMSCRVLALKVAVPILSSVLSKYIKSIKCKEIQALLTQTERNLPCHSVYSDLGFSIQDPNIYHLKNSKKLTPVDRSIYQVRWNPN